MQPQQQQTYAMPQPSQPQLSKPPMVYGARDGTVGGAQALLPQQQAALSTQQPLPAQEQQQQQQLALQQTPQVFIEMSAVVGKQVITRSTGRCLGVIGNLWVDPVRLLVVSLDLDDKRGVGSTRVANFPLSRLTQVHVYCYYT
jgi:hypothetical protein